MNTLHALIFSFIILNLVKKIKKDKKDIHVTTVSVDLCVKEVKLILDRALWRKIVDTLKVKILTIIELNLVRKDLSFYYTAIFRGLYCLEDLEDLEGFTI